jgi:hypothetical protein
MNNSLAPLQNIFSPLSYKTTSIVMATDLLHSYGGIDSKTSFRDIDISRIYPDNDQALKLS